ncbi:hypothetical protein K501DRAFT_266442 [Backusella circina FSU 941]|nr:hypothetical protein K501DRAFT_266442 [Backusella circina FSU 941]
MASQEPRQAFKISLPSAERVSYSISSSPAVVWSIVASGYRLSLKRLWIGILSLLVVTLFVAKREGTLISFFLNIPFSSCLFLRLLDIIKEIKQEEEENPIARWCKDVLENKDKLLRSDLVTTYWITRTTASDELEEDYIHGQVVRARKRKALLDLKNILDDPNFRLGSIQASSSNPYPNTDHIEGDSVLFGTESPGSIIKNNAKKKLPQFKNLSDKEKLVVGLCDSGILELSDTEGVSQKMLFTVEEWDIMVKKYSKIPKLHKKKELSDTLKDINKVYFFLTINSPSSKDIALVCSENMYTSPVRFLNAIDSNK